MTVHEVVGKSAIGFLAEPGPRWGITVSDDLRRWLFYMLGLNRTIATVALIHVVERQRLDDRGIFSEYLPDMRREIAL
jgi:hypothetical protein